MRLVRRTPGPTMLLVWVPSIYQYYVWPRPWVAQPHITCDVTNLYNGNATLTQSKILHRIGVKISFKLSDVPDLGFSWTFTLGPTHVNYSITRIDKPCVSDTYSVKPTHKSVIPEELTQTLSLLNL